MGKTKAALAALAALLVTACVTAEPPQAGADAALDALAERTVALQLSYDPAVA